MTHNAHLIRGFVSSCGWVVAPPPWRHGPQVRAPWHHGGHGAVDVVGPVAPPGHACSCGDAGVYTDRRKWPLGAVLGHLCTLLRHESRYELRRELRRVARAPQPPWRAGGAPSRWAPLPWSGRQTLRERRRREVGVFAETSTHTNPRGANSWASFPTIVLS